MAEGNDEIAAEEQAGREASPAGGQPVRVRTVEKTPWKKELKDTIITIVVTVAVVLFVSHYLFNPVVIEGSSMYPTLADGDRAYTNEIGKKLNGVERFDIVTAYDEQDDILIVKRVIGLPGETIECRDDVLYVNGEPVSQDFLDEEYVSETLKSTGRSSFTDDFGPVELGESEYWLMGDNRPSSVDSRVFGPFTLEEIRTKGIFVFFPFDHFGIK